MKTPTLIFIICLLLATPFFYKLYFEDRLIAAKVFENSQNGKLAILELPNGKYLIDTDNITSDDFLNHILLKTGLIPTFKSKSNDFDLVFSIPKSIRNYEYVMSYKDSVCFERTESVSLADYQSWKSIYKTYDDFLKMEKSLYQNELNYKFDWPRKRIFYTSKNYQQNHMIYKVETPLSNYLCEVVVLHDGNEDKVILVSSKNN